MSRSGIGSPAPADRGERPKDSRPLECTPVELSRRYGLTPHQVRELRLAGLVDSHWHKGPVVEMTARTSRTMVCVGIRKLTEIMAEWQCGHKKSPDACNVEAFSDSASVVVSHLGDGQS